MCDDIISKCKFSKYRRKMEKTRFLNERNPLDSLWEICMPGVRELLPAAARLLSKTHILPAAARTIRYSRTLELELRALYDTLELSKVQVVYCRAFWATTWYSRTFYRIRLDAWWQTFAWRGFTGTIREWAAKCAMYAQFKGVTGERMRQQQFCLTIWIWGVGEASSTTISLTSNNNNNNKINFFWQCQKQQLH